MAKKKQKENKGRELTGMAVRIIAQNGGSIGREELRGALALEVGKWNPAYAKEKDVRGRLKWVGQLDHFAARYAKDIIGKENRQWFLTDKGIDMTHDKEGKCLSDAEIAKACDKLWAKKRPGRDADDKSAQGGGDESALDHGDDATGYIKDKTRDPKNTGVWFENLVVALFRGMGYQHVYRCGKSGDGSVDVVAYKDKLGATLPRIKVQAKHRKGETPPPISEEVLQRLASAVHDGEIGVCVTSSSFSKNAKIFARTCDKHLELVDIDRLVELWTEHYPHMTEADKSKLPLTYPPNERNSRGKGDAPD